MKNKRKLILASIVTSAAAVPIYMLAPGRVSKRMKAPFVGRNFAHRGLHTRDKKIPENSLPAFRLAAEAGYGVELDVQLSKDGRVVVFHDDTLERVCGVNKRVDELDYSELKKLRLCGTKETIPLFTEALNAISGRGPVICELKNGKRNRELCEKTYKIISNYTGEICVESFSPIIVAWFRIHAKDLLRGQLAMPTNDYEGEVKLPTAVLLSHTMLNFISRPQFIAYKLANKPMSVRIAYLLGAMKVCWTSHEPRNEKGKDAVIFEFYKPRRKFK